MMNRLEHANTQLKSFKVTATGGFAFYLILCTVLATITGVYSLLVMTARSLYPLIS